MFRMSKILIYEQLVKYYLRIRESEEIVSEINGNVG